MIEQDLDMTSQFPDLEEFEGLADEQLTSELKIERVELEPMGDGQRVTVCIDISSMRERPNLEIVLLSPEDRVVAEMLVVETHSTRQIVTLHLRPPDPTLRYTAKIGLFLKQKLIDFYETELIWA